MLEALYAHRLVFVTGKGGVGKSTLTAALGMHAARTGRRTLVCETDTFSAMEPLLGVDRPVGHEPVAAGPNLWACNIQSEQSLADLVHRFVPSARIAKAAVSNRLARLFFRTAPSMYELSVLYRIKSLMDAREGGRPKYDTIVIDLPATGHAITFLGVPETANKVLRVGSVAEMSAELAAQLRDPEITDMVIVCIPEEMPVNESIELHRAAHEKLGLNVEAIFINMVRPAPVPEEGAAALEFLAEIYDDKPGPGGVGVLAEGGELGLDWSRQDRMYIEKLHEGIQGANFVEVPYIYRNESDVDLIRRIADHLDPS
jgi:arsenite/tail-anchored protein-transporting ATPase